MWCSSTRWLPVWSAWYTSLPSWWRRRWLQGLLRLGALVEPNQCTFIQKHCIHDNSCWSAHASPTSEAERTASDAQAWHCTGLRFSVLGTPLWDSPEGGIWTQIPGAGGHPPTHSEHTGDAQWRARHPDMTSQGPKPRRPPVTDVVRAGDRHAQQVVG